MPACIPCVGTGLTVMGGQCRSCHGRGEVTSGPIDFTPHIAYLRERLGDRSPALDPAAIEPVIALLEREARLQRWANTMLVQALEGFAVRWAKELQQQLEIQVPHQEEETSVPWHKTPDPFE